ncbi:MAG: YcxB family protein [Lachnospiraceae bacterium]|nr:YcxB family protein [Lachnospiraceae bacterium]
MPLTFSSKIDVNDLLKYNFYQNYRSVGGLLFVVFAAIMFAAGISEMLSGRPFATICGYFIIGIGLLAWTPFKLKLIAPRIYALSPVLQEPLTYTLDEDGITLHTDVVLSEPTVTTGDPQTEKVSWDMIYKVVTTKSSLLIYTNRKNAWIIPLRNITKEYPKIKEICEAKLDRHRCKIK